MKSKLHLWLIMLLSVMAVQNAAAQSATFTTNKPAGTEIRMTCKTTGNVRPVGKGVKVIDHYIFHGGYDSYALVLQVEQPTFTLEADFKTILVGKCGVTAIDITKCPNLEHLACVKGGLLSDDNVLTELNVKQNLKLKTLDCTGSNISQLDLSANKELTNLDCSFCPNLTKLDLTENTNLRSLSVEQSANIKELKIDKCTKLESLYLAFVPIEKLDVTIYPNLKRLSLRRHKLSYLDLSQNPELIWLRIQEHKLTGLDLKANKKLKNLICYTSGLKELDLSNNLELETLECGYNKLTKLDLSKHRKLTRVICFNNKLTELWNMTNNDSFIQLICYNNQLSVQGMEKYLETFPNREEVYKDDAVYIEFSHINGSQEQNVMLISQVDRLKNKFWQIRGYDTVEKKWKPYPGVVTEPIPTLLTTQKAIGEELVIESLSTKNEKQPNIKGATLVGSWSNGEKMTLKLESHDVILEGRITKINCTGQQLTKFDGSQCKDITSLMLSNNLLTELNVANFADLKSLNCNGNQLQSLDIANNNDLAYIDCSHNQLKTLNTSDNPKLLNLNCSNNQIGNIDLSQNRELEYLYCNNNQLAALNLANCTERLSYVECQMNQIKKAEMEKCVNSIRTLDFLGTFRGIALHKDKEGNELTKAQVATLTRKNWEVKAWDSNENKWVEYKGENENSSVIATTNSEKPTIVAIYTLNGQRIASLQQGVNIVKMSNGTTQKIVK